MNDSARPIEDTLEALQPGIVNLTVLHDDATSMRNVDTTQRYSLYLVSARAPATYVVHVLFLRQKRIKTGIRTTRKKAFFGVSSFFLLDARHYFGDGDDPACDLYVCILRLVLLRTPLSPRSH